MDHIILIGFMGAGKTAVGKRLARQMDLTFVDTDDMIEEQQGRSISDIFAKNGEAYFRSLETEVLCQLLDSKERCVISVGGGTACPEAELACFERTWHGGIPGGGDRYAAEQIKI